MTKILLIILELPAPLQNTFLNATDTITSRLLRCKVELKLLFQPLAGLATVTI